MKYTTQTAKINTVISNYFTGIYTGDIDLLKASFHPNAFLYGNIKGADYFKSLGDYLDGVQNRKSPQEVGEKNNMEIISTEILGDVAMVKLHVPMLGYNYYDYLSLAVVEGEWKIVNKLFTHVE